MRKVILLAVLIVCVLAGAAVIHLLPRLRRMQATHAPVKPAVDHYPGYPKLRPTTHSANGPRQVLLRERDNAIRNNDLVHAATINAGLSQEALQRAARVERAWMNLQDPTTKLFPQERKAPWWTYENAGADFFGFILDVAVRQNTDTLPDVTATIEHESKLAPPGELCISVQIHTLEPMKRKPPGGTKPELETEARKMFTSSEYVKDGLLSVYERLGPGNPSAARMLEVLDNILKHSQQASKGGIIPSTGQEENGNVIQAVSRLSFATGREDYAEMSARIAEAWVTQLLPAGAGLPMQDYDFATDKPISATVKLRDHGNEVFPGMAEAFALAVARSDDSKWKDRADRWAEPIATMYEQMFRYGINKEGLLISALHVPNHHVSISVPNDTWGYMFDGVLLYVQAARRQGKIDPHRLEALQVSVEKACKVVASKINYPWQEGIMDGSADSFESAMYMACYDPATAPVMLPWVDDQIEQLYSFQQPDGFITPDYLDGNYIRTVLMYADLRSGGWYVQPWREDVSVGFAQNDKGEGVVLVSSKQPYSGVLHADEIRHETYMHLPWNWPRLNSWPEWFALSDAMRVTEATGVTTKPRIAELRAGLKIDLPAEGSLTLRFDSIPAAR